MKRILKEIFKYLGYLLLSFLIVVILTLSGFSIWAFIRESKGARDLAPTTGKFIQTAGGEIFIQEMGPVNGQPLIFIHGSLAWSETWREVMIALSAQGYRTIAIDLPPFGFSNRPDSADYSTRAQAQRIINLSEAMNLNKPILVGHSFGGAPTTEAAMMAPYKFGGLVLIDAAVDPNFKAPESEDKLMKFFFRTGIFKNAVLSATLTNPLLTQNLLQRFIYDSEDANKKIVDIYRMPLSLKNTTQDLGDWLPTLIFSDTGLLSQSRQNYQNFGLPTLIIWGEKDTITPINIAYELDVLIPNSEISILEEVGHIPQIEDAPQLNDSLILGLKSLQL